VSTTTRPRSDDGGRDSRDTRVAIARTWIATADAWLASPEANVDRAWDALAIASALLCEIEGCACKALGRAIEEGIASRQAAYGGAEEDETTLAH